MEGRREKDRFLKAGSSNKIRTHLAEANLQAKLHSNFNVNKPTITVNEYDVLSQMRRDRTAKDPGFDKAHSLKSYMIRNNSESHSHEHLQPTMASWTGKNTSSGYGFPSTWQPRTGTPGDPQIVQFGCSRNAFYSRDEALLRNLSAKAGTKPPIFPD